ncbi:hypothetical protein CBR_g37663 [Chara braunii]|uniref:Uncharacterized protein n=1 Tax=Chara braunii TaxID=69332 RepID=A0A388LND8_CHABU|nr:hypothetical protein CBR_g37663 [Chara braunii]|eukprot:GBG83866.1 hypothetical protein CBR_g37663 [Chara braunii]
MLYLSWSVEGPVLSCSQERVQPCSQEEGPVLAPRGGSCFGPRRKAVTQKGILALIGKTCEKGLGRGWRQIERAENFRREAWSVEGLVLSCSQEGPALFPGGGSCFGPRRRVLSCSQEEVPVLASGGYCLVRRRRVPLLFPGGGSLSWSLDERPKRRSHHRISTGEYSILSRVIVLTIPV